jgi:hypothetical protein
MRGGESVSGVLFCPSGVHAAFYDEVIRRLKVHVDVVPINYNERGNSFIEQKINRKYSDLLSNPQNGRIFFAFDKKNRNISLLRKLNWHEIKACLEEQYLNLNIVQIVSVDSIEDWLLRDYTNIVKFLKLPVGYARPNANGFEAMKQLYRDSDNPVASIYLPSSDEKARMLIDCLDMRTIINSLASELSPLK